MNPFMYLFNYSPKSILIYILVLASCGGAETKDQSVVNDTQRKILSGTLIESVPCRTSKEHDYAYYLPSYYDATKKYPLIIAFDAHARGPLAVSRFKNAAELYGYVIVASNNAKNGLRDINPIVNSLWDDVLSRFSIDQQRIYTAGFSGGAKIASSVAIYKGGVKGVIACGSGMPTPGQELTKKFDYISIVGLNDFNYQEINTLDKALTESGFVNQLITFNGGHEWPPIQEINKALQWLDLMAMKQGQIPINDNLVRNYTSSYADTINQLIMADDNFGAYKLYHILLKDLEGIYDIADYQSSYKELLKNPQIKKGIENEKEEKRIELDNQEKILNSFKNNEFDKLKNEILNLKDKERGSHLSKRLLAFTGMLSYIYTESAVNSQNNAAFNGFIEIYETVEPQNPDKEFFKACQAMMDEKPEMALGYLQKAVHFGYSDADKLQKIGYFEQLRTKPEFDLLIQKAIKNSKN